MSNGWSGSDVFAPQNEPGIDYELGTRFSVNNDIQVYAVRAWGFVVSPTAPVTRTGRLWSSIGALLGTAPMDPVLPDGWTTYDLVSPVLVSAGATIDVSYNTLRYYSAQSGGYPRSSTDLAVTATQGRFNDTPGAQPGTISASFYGIDIVYNLAGNLPPVITGISVSITGLAATVTATVEDENPGSLHAVWDWGDGTTTVSPVGVVTAQHTYAVPGVYPVFVVVTDDADLEDIHATVVEVLAVGVPPEAEVNRRITKAFIDARPTLVSLTPRTRVRQANGSYRWQNGTARPDQIMRVIEQAPTSVIILEDGTQRVLDYVLLAEWDAQIAKGDVFTYEGDLCKITDIYHNNGYEIRGLVTRQVDAPITI